MDRFANVNAIGIPWYKRADYAGILRIMADRQSLPGTFDQWQGRAEQIEAQLKRSGKVVVRAHIDPKEFVAWCATRNLHVDAHARNVWANEAAYRHLVEQHRKS